MKGGRKNFLFCPFQEKTKVPLDLLTFAHTHTPTPTQLPPSFFTRFQWYKILHDIQLRERERVGCGYCHSHLSPHVFLLFPFFGWRRNKINSGHVYNICSMYTTAIAVGYYYVSTDCFVCPRHIITRSGNEWRIMWQVERRAERGATNLFHTHPQYYYWDYATLLSFVRGSVWLQSRDMWSNWSTKIELKKKR